MRKRILFFVSMFSFMSILGSLRAQSTYVADSIVFDGPRDSIRIGATLTTPTDGSSFPALVLISGTGQQDRDGKMADYPLFKHIAEYLSTNGIVVLRMDDRGIGETTGIYEHATTEDFASDALAAIAYLKTRPDIDPDKIGLLGHSEGGAAASIAALKSKDISYIISMAGLATNGLDALIQQNEDLVGDSPLDPRDKERSNEINKLMFATAYQYAESPLLEERLNETYNRWKQRDMAYFKTLGIEFDHFRFPIWSYVQQAISPWYRYFVRYNAEMVLSYVDIPILAINGDRDLMVSPKNLDNWKKYSLAGKNGKVTTKLLTNFNHLFQRCDACTIQEYRSLDPMPDEILEEIVNWIQGHAE